jgi:hypothetical protein
MFFYSKAWFAEVQPDFAEFSLQSYKKNSETHCIPLLFHVIVNATIHH